MDITKKVFRAFFTAIMPGVLFEAISYRCRKTKAFMMRNWALLFFWRVVFFPFVLIISLLEAFIKTIVIWVMPKTLYESFYFGLRYALVTWYSADEELRKQPIRIKYRRLKLLCEFIFKARERKVSFGNKNPDKIFYVIRPPYFLRPNELSRLNRHLLAQYFICCQHLSYISEKDWIPVVDWENYGPFAHCEEYPVNGTRNGWEYYWKQPSDYTLEEVYQSKNVILSCQNTMEGKACLQSSFEGKLEEYKKYHPMLFKRISILTEFNESTASFIDNQQRMLFPKGARVLGVNVRGTAYGAMRFYRHTIQPTIEEMIVMIHEKLEKLDMDYVFFACELESHVNKVKEEFGEKAIIFPRTRYTEAHHFTEPNPLYVQGHRYQVNLEYLTEMVLLSRCNAIISGISAGQKAALIWNNHKYEYVEIISRGLW